MEELFQIYDLLITNNFVINILNLTINIPKDQYFQIYTEKLNLFKNCLLFKNIKKIFPKIQKSDLEIINYIKIYNVMNNNQTISFFNPKLININYNDEYFEYEQNSTSFVLENDLKIKVLKYTKLTCKIIHFLQTEKNYFTEFIKKQNKKTKLSISLWKKKYLYKEEFNIKILNKESRFSSINYEIIDNHKIKKKFKLHVILEKEKIISNCRISLPNTICICIDDNYIYINKIIISMKLVIHDIKFESFIKKVYFLIKLYYKIYQINIYDINFNLSVKKKNNIDIIKFETTNLLLLKHVKITKKFINIKYITKYQELVQIFKLLTKHYKNQIKKKNILSKLVFTDILNLDKNKIDQIINLSQIL